MPLDGCDVLLGMPWFHCLKASTQFFEKKISFTHRGRNIVLDVILKGDLVPQESYFCVLGVCKREGGSV